MDAWNRLRLCLHYWECTWRLKHRAFIGAFWTWPEQYPEEESAAARQQLWAAASERLNRARAIVREL